MRHGNSSVEKESVAVGKLVWIGGIQSAERQGREYYCRNIQR